MLEMLLDKLSGPSERLVQLGTCLLLFTLHITSNYQVLLTLFNLPTYALKVVSFSGEKHAITMYNKLIRKAYESALLEGIVTGLGLGSMELSLFCSYGLAIWYGSRLIVERGYNGGSVISTIMAVTIGAM